MKATYIDFISANPNCSNYADNKDAQRIFDFLNKDENILKMVTRRKNEHLYIIK